MPYCILADIEKRLPSINVGVLTDDAGGVAIDNAKVDQAISDADTTINSYLQSRYSMPFATTPKLINRLSADLAIYFLYQRKYDADMPDSMRARYTDAVRMLDAIANGKINLDDVPVTEVVIADGIRTNKSKDSRVFNAVRLGQW